MQRLAVLGDSLAVSPSLQQSFPARLQARIDEQHLPWVVVNAGVSGDTTADGLRRRAQVLNGEIAALVLELGANDGLQGIATTTISANLSDIIADAQRRNVRVLLCGMETPPLHGVDYSISFHFVFPTVAASLSVPLVPFLLEGIALDPAFTGPDGVHPNAAGAQRIADTVWPYLQPLLSSNRSDRLPPSAQLSASRGERSRSSSMRFEASAFESVPSNSSPVSRQSVSR